MRGNRSGALAAASCLLLAACSTGGGNSAPTTTAPSRTGPATSLLQTCPNVEKAILPLGAVPTAAVLESARKQIAALSVEADAETQKLLAGLVTSLAAYRDARPGQDTLNAKSALAGSLGTFASRCLAAGAQAPQ
jgi:hypothetical protein